MKITNIHNLPEVFVRYVEANSRPPKPERISASSLIGSPLIRTLLMEHWDNLEADVIDYIWMMTGSCMHSLLEEHAPKNSLAEEGFSFNFLGNEISLRPDLYHHETISDYKFTSAYSFILGSKPEWEAQLNIYRYGYIDSGFQVNKLQIVAILRDWMKSKSLADHDYPQQQVLLIEVPTWGQLKTNEYITTRLYAHKNNSFGECTSDEKWARPTTYAVMKAGRKTAMRVLKGLGEAQEWQKKNGGETIEMRPGAFIRCRDYCPVRTVCQFNIYKEGTSNDSIS